MNILAFSDLHDDLEALKRLVDWTEHQSTDYMLFAGDFSLRPYTREQWKKFQQTKDRRTFLQEKRQHNNNLLHATKTLLDSTGIPYFVIPGNYDPDLSDIFEQDLHLKTRQLETAVIAGYGGVSVGPSHINPLIKLEEIIDFNAEELRSFLETTNPDIILSHTPPYKLCDTLYRGAMQERQPSIIIYH